MFWRCVVVNHFVTHFYDFRKPEVSENIKHPSNAKKWTQQINFNDVTENGTPKITIPINLFLDDTSTHKSRRWKPLHCVQMQMSGNRKLK